MRKIDLNNFQVATSETVRDINSRIMLNLVRKHQPVSRADLMRYSGLQRSTVSAITGQLISERWLKVGAVGDLPRGRKPTFLHLNTDRCGVIGVDVQPDTTTLAVASMDSRILARELMPTPKDPSEFIARLGRRINRGRTDVALRNAHGDIRQFLAVVVLNLAGILRVEGAP